MIYGAAPDPGARAQARRASSPAGSCYSVERTLSRTRKERNTSSRRRPYEETVLAGGSPGAGLRPPARVRPGRSPRSRSGPIPFLNCLTGPDRQHRRVPATGAPSSAARGDQRGRRHQGQAGEGGRRRHGPRPAEGLGRDGRAS
ncbi:MAG: hypothetical protein MZU95_04585 [Desulfomicrobium escambiense]|nr:hypothetical protein [Desulfomicrobium escambiense]